jgi:hypothetical protein
LLIINAEPKLITQVISTIKNILEKIANSYNKPERVILYDIIGDIHGYCDELKSLLIKLDYKLENGFWSHKTRKAVFVGDFVSRGPNTRGALEIIKAMVENNAAHAILGNHELNMIGYFTYSKSEKNLYTPAPANKIQLESIRDQYYKEPDRLAEHVKWLRTLPLALYLGRLRIVHAYWSNEHINLINQTITKGKITKSLIKEIFKNETEFAKAIKQTTRGIEIILPPDLIIKDEKNVRRTNFRIKWWKNPKGKTFNELTYGNRFYLPFYTVPEQIILPFEVYTKSEPLVFFGHYCSSESNLIVAPNVCCVDNCIAGNGQLAAYRWDGKKRLSFDNFVFQERKK